MKKDTFSDIHINLGLVKIASVCRPIEMSTSAVGIVLTCYFICYFIFHLLFISNDRISFLTTFVFKLKFHNLYIHRGLILIWELSSYFKIHITAKIGVHFNHQDIFSRFGACLLESSIHQRRQLKMMSIRVCRDVTS